MTPSPSRSILIIKRASAEGASFSSLKHLTKALMIEVGRFAH